MSEERGFLTKTDREFLTGEKEYTGKSAKQQRYERREAIAARTRAAFRDFALLYEALDEHERNRIFDVAEAVDPPGVRVEKLVDLEDESEIRDQIGADDKEHRDTINEFRDALTDTIAFLYLSLEGMVDSSTIRERSFRIPFGVILHGGVAKAEYDRRDDDVPLSYIDVTFDVHVKQGAAIDYEYVLGKIARYRTHELTEAELQRVLALLAGEGGEKDLREFADEIEQLRQELDLMGHLDEADEE